jgi:7-dehydrocholesterol reductase
MKFLPGKRFEGPVAPSGHIPVYKANGVQAFFTSILLYALFSYFGMYTPGTVYKNLGPIFAFLNIFSLIFCFFLTLKGRYFPSTPDCGTTGSFIVDYFWGTELYPRILGFDVKTFTNCRFGMMGWALLVIDYTLYQYAKEGHFIDSTVVSASLQLIYIFKFFLWETGYWRSLDIMHDRAGFYLCWGCCCWVTSVYTSQTMFLAKTPLVLGFFRSFFVFVFGVLMIWINYDSDRQRFDFRKHQGKAKIWGKEPEYIVASYTTENGETKTNLLLVSGYWSFSRHFHYVPEILAALAWTVPYHTVIMPYFYVIYLTILLTDRAVRDDHRCRAKYGEAWEKYCKRVPYRIVPYVF